MKHKKIGVFVGSVRRGSYSRAVAEAVMGLLPDALQAKTVEIGNLELFQQDFDDDGATPESWKLFRKTVSELDGFLFVTPEYNRSYPALLKNALDIASRPYGQNLWSGKPGAVISVSPGKLSGFGANHHLRQVLSFLNVYTMQQPEAYVGNIESALDDRGKLTDKGTEAFLQTIADQFANWVTMIWDGESARIGGAD